MLPDRTGTTQKSTGPKYTEKESTTNSYKKYKIIEIRLTGVRTTQK